MLQDENFLKDGGIMGFYCTHDYAHATESAIKYLPWCLKGLDMIVYETFKSLGCEILLRPVYPTPDDEIDHEEAYEKFNGKDVIGKALEGMQFIYRSGDDECGRFMEVCRC